MKAIRELSLGFLGAALSIALVTGSMFLSSAENLLSAASIGAAPLTSPAFPALNTPAAATAASIVSTLTQPAAETALPSPTFLLPASATSPSAISQPPATLPGFTPTPPPTAAPSFTPSAAPCGPPAGWVRHVVLPEETLNRLSQVYNVSIADLQKANCLGGSTLLRPGAVIFTPHRQPAEGAGETAPSTFSPATMPATPGGVPAATSSP